MPKQTPLKNNFNGGEISPYVLQREDIAQFGKSSSYVYNFSLLPEGPAVFRSAFKFISEVKNSANSVRLLPFEYDVDQAYVIEAQPGTFRFYTNETLLLSGGSPVETPNVYSSSQLQSVKYANSADVLYLNHVEVPEYKLTRTTLTSWSFARTYDGNNIGPPPFARQNSTATTLTAAAVTGNSVAITASSGIFNSSFEDTIWKIEELIGSKYDEWKTATAYGAGAYVRQGSNVYLTVAGGTSGTRLPVHQEGTESDGGVSWEYLHSGAGWFQVLVGGYVSPTQVNVKILSRLPQSSLTGTNLWSEPEWSSSRGWPIHTTFYGDRRFIASKFSVHGSFVGDYDNFSTTKENGVITADSAVSYGILSNEINQLRWIRATDKGLAIGTSGGEWLLRPSNLNEALTPTNAKADRVTRKRVADIQPLTIEDSVVFAQRSLKKIHGLQYDFSKDSFVALDLSLLARHLLRGRIKELHHQAEPFGFLWVVCENGEFFGLTLNEAQEVRGWFRVVPGGYYDAAQTQPARVESASVIPSMDGGQDDIYVTVQRWINGGIKRYVEKLSEEWDESKAYTDARFLDSYIVYSGAPTITISGLGHLEGQQVKAVCDGVLLRDGTYTVISGSITLERPASHVVVGLPYIGEIITMPNVFASADGTAMGKISTAYKLSINILHSLGGRYGSPTLPVQKFIPLEYEKGLPMDQRQDFYTGYKRVTPPGKFDVDSRISIQQHQPFPFILRSITMPTYTTSL